MSRLFLIFWIPKQDNTKILSLLMRYLDIVLEIVLKKVICSRNKMLVVMYSLCWEKMNISNFILSF